MLDLIDRLLLDPSGLTPHGFCLSWEPWLIWTHAASDLGISFAYFTIPLALMHFAHRRRDLVFKPLLWLFAAFILLCGTDHLLNLLTIWVPAYGIEAVVKAAVAIVSLTTAIAVWALMPKALEMPSQAQMQAANDAARESEARAQGSYVHTPLSLHVLDADGIITAVSDRWLDLLGYARAAVVGRHITQFEEPVSARAMPLDWAQMLSQGQVLDMPRRIVRQDGAVLDVLASARMEHSKGGAVRILGALVDVTERMRAETALRESEERSRLALSAVNSGGTWDWDVVNDRIYANEPLARIFGIDPVRAAAGIPLTEYFVNIPSEHSSRMVDEYARAMRVGGDCSVVHPVTQPDGSARWFLAKSHCTLAPDGTPLRMPGILIDITTQHTLEEQLRQSQKMEAVGQLTGGLAHDFNNMLQGITGSLELLKKRVAQGQLASADRYITAAQDDAGRAVTLTQRLLAFSRRQVLDPKLVNPDALIAGMADLIQRTAGPGITVVTTPAPGLWAILCDPSQMENALLNLCINACDAMPGGGRLIIEAENVTLDRQGGFEWDMTPGEYVAVCVTDNGMGMPPAVMARAFDPFFTTKPTGEGTGLGLSMIHGFAQQSGGQVRIASEVDAGTTVRIYLPRHPAEPGGMFGQIDEKCGPEPAQAGETILVVDDEPTIRMSVTEVLQEQGYVVIEAADGASGLKVLRSDVRLDLLVSDMGLPGGMNGRQMADAARISRPDLKVLFITGYAADAMFGNDRLEVGMAILAKPFTLGVLVANVKAIIDKQTTF